MSISLYSKISESLAQRISDQSYAVGAAMPTENELAEEFGASRHTVRAALRQLQDLGLISRHRGSGTVVRALQPKAGYSQSLSSLEDLVHLAERTPRDVRKIQEVVVDTELAAQLGCGPGTHWLQISSTRSEAGRDPMVWTDLYVDAHYRDIKKLVLAHPDRLVSELIESHYGRRIARVEQTIAACAIPARVAKALNAPPDSPGLLIFRQYRDQGGAMIVASTSYHPAGRYQFSMTLIRE
jgi:DNA-binding GntR family transcriptional regulator